jgi:glycerophosphoryl diester phosphodiesterase
LSVRITTAKRVRAIQQAGYEVWVYTVNRPEEAERLAEMGVSAIFSDRPDLMLAQASGHRRLN